MQQSSIRDIQPRLESVFGPITEEEVADIRRILHTTDEKLLALARHFGLSRAGWEGSGLDLYWYPSGQVGISSFVEPCDGNRNCVSFCVSLAPAWSRGEILLKPAWDIEIEIYADCQHTTRHHSMDLVHNWETRVTSPREAAAALQNTVEELARLAEQTPIDEWLRMASDG